MATLILVCIICAIIGAMLLSPHGEERFGCLLGAILGPIGVIVAFVEKGRLARVEDNKRHTEQMRALAKSWPEDEEDKRACPFCAERIKVQATVCRFCGRDIVTVA